jgi:predicted PurR-regulated permease PerM
LAIFFGAFLAYLFYPLRKWLSKHIKSSTLPPLIVCVLVILIILIPGVFFIKTLVQESYLLFILIKEKLSLGLFNHCNNSFCNVLREIASDSIMASQIKEVSVAVTQWVITKGSNILIGVPRMVINLFVMFFIMFYFLKVGENFVAKLNTYLNLKKSKYAHVLLRLKEIIHGVVFGYFVVALIQGALGALGFFIFGFSSPLFWGMLMAFLALVPYFGASIVWVPAVVFIFLDGIFKESNWLIVKSVLLLLYGFFIISGIDNVIRPKLMGSKAKIHPAVILLGLFGGVFVFGPLGVIIGPLVLSLTFVIMNVYLRDKY